MTINLFGYTIIIAKRRQSIRLGRKRGPSNACKLASNGKYLYLTTPDGVALPYQLSLTINDDMHRAGRARVELYIDPEFVPYKPFNPEP